MQLCDVHSQSDRLRRPLLRASFKLLQWWRSNRCLWRASRKWKRLLRFLQRLVQRPTWRQRLWLLPTISWCTYRDRKYKTATFPSFPITYKIQFFTNVTYMIIISECYHEKWGLIFLFFYFYFSRIPSDVTAVSTVNCCSLKAMKMWDCCLVYFIRVRLQTLC